MSDRKPSRGDIVSRLPIETLADLRDAIAADPVLGPRQKEARRSALQTFCKKWLRKEPAAVPADFRAVKRELARLRPTLNDVSEGRFANVASLINRSFLSFRKDLIDTRKTTLLPAWRRLFSEVGGTTLRYACSRFARWCSVNNIQPAQVDQAVADRYAADLAERMLAAKPRQAYVSMCRGWNAAAEGHPLLWPQVRLDPGDRRKAYILPREQIDAGFHADLEHMLARFCSKLDPIEGFRKPYEPGTINELRRILQRLYTVAVTHHCPTPTIAALADLVSLDVVRSILGYYIERFGNENTRSAGKYAHFLYVVAKYWVKATEADLDILQRFRTTLKPPAAGMTEKNRAVLRLFDDERIDRLLYQGANAFAEFNRLAQPRHRHALALQHAFAIELLIAAPVRSQNLASICLSRHLVWGRNGRQETVHLVFPATEVKNDQDLEFCLRHRLVEMLKVYLAEARPLLADAGNNYLFPGEGLGHKGQGLLSKQITEAAKKAVGVRVTAHQFRHLLGYIYLKENPGAHEVVRRFLGHKRIETTIKFYAGMEQDAAIAHVDRFMEARRQRIVRPRAKRKRLSSSSREKGKGPSRPGPRSRST